MNSLERLQAVIRFQRADRPPLAPELIGVTATMAGVPISGYVRSGEIIARCQVEAVEQLGGDALFAVADLCVEAEALGCQLRYPDDNYPHVTGPIINGVDDLESLKIPDPRSAGRMPEVLKAVRLLRERADGRTPVVANAIGPMTLASRIMNIEKMLYMIVDHPDRFHKILSFCGDVSRRFAEALIEEGADAVLCFDPAASPSVLPARIFKEFEAAQVRSLFATAKELKPDVITWYSVAGPVQMNMGIITGVAADITTIDYLAPIEVALGHSGYTAINGNIKPALFLEGTPEDVYTEAAALLKATRSSERFILGSGCEIPLYSKRENIAALAEALRHETESFETLNEPEEGAHEITILPHRKKVHVAEGATLFEAARSAGVGITAYCDLSGSCGECVVKVKEGQLPPPDRLESMQLKMRGGSPDERLACVTTATRNLEIYVPYASRRQSRHGDVSPALYEKSMEALIGNFGFSPAARIEKIDISGFPLEGGSPGEWVESALNGFSAGQKELKKLETLARNKNREAYAVLDARTGEVIDFARSKNLYGLAVDFSGPVVSGYIHDLTTGESKGAGYVENPSMKWSLDTIAAVTQDNPGGHIHQKLKGKLIDAINGLVTWFYNNHSIFPDQIYQMLIVGAPAVTRSLLGAEYDGDPAEPGVFTASRLGSGTKIVTNSRARTRIPRGVPGKAGAGVLAGVVATGTGEGEGLSLFVNLGSPGEIVLGNRNRLLFASVAAGPVFESAGINGANACQDGLIHEIEVDAANQAIGFKTLGGAAPFALCGGAFINILAEFRKGGVIDSRGRFVNREKWPQLSDEVFVLAPKHRTATYNPICVTSENIQEAQRAKAAFLTGVNILMKKMGASPEQVSRVHVTGPLGAITDPRSVLAAGLIPDFPNAEVSFVKAASGLGARAAMLSEGAMARMMEAAARLEVVDLSGDDDYVALFTDNMILP